jgi:hypothetical protein
MAAMSASSHDPLLHYFAGEKAGAAVCLALGIGAVLFAFWVFRSHAAFRAMAIPVGLIGLAQLALGAGLWVRTDPQVASLQAGLTDQPQSARQSELARMERVNANFRVIEAVEAALILASLVLALAFRGKPTLTAVGMGLLLQASVMLAFDLFAEHRAHVYTAWLRGPAPG